MTLGQARADYDAAHPEGPEFDSLSHDEQMEILREAVLRERRGRKR